MPHYRFSHQRRWCNRPRNDNLEFGVRKRIFSGKAEVAPDAAVSVSYQLARNIEEAMRSPGFRRFQNGGTPLFERRLDDWIEEVVIRPDSTSPLGGIRITVHLGNNALRDMRARYWEPVSRAPGLVCSGNVGELDLPPKIHSWPRTLEPEQYATVAALVRETAIPWFRTFREDDLLDRLLNRAVPLVDTATALELSILLGGVKAGRKYASGYEKSSDALTIEMERLNHASYRPTEHLTTIQRMARVVASYRLLD